MYIPLLRRPITITLGLMALVTARAQTPAPSASATDDDSIVKLSPFEVQTEKDIGYRAASSLSGSRMNEEIKNIPASVSVLTGDFITDIGATDLNEASKYMIGGNYRPSAYNDVRGFQFRGFRTSITRRNMFSWFGIMDNFSTERVDVVRGPNSLLFGNNEPGGLVNTQTKRAQFKNATIVTARIGANDQYRFTADVNQRFSATLAGRANFVFEDRGSWRSWAEERREGVQLAGTWRPFKRTTVRAEFEYLNRPATRALALPRDAFSLWNGTPYVINSTPAAGSGLSRFGTSTTAGANAYVYFNNTNTLYDLRGYGATVGPTGNASLPVKDEFILPREVNYGGPDFTQNLAHWSTTAIVEQRIGDNLFMELGFNEATARDRRFEPFGFTSLFRDPNPTLPGGGANPNFGDYYYDFFLNRTINGNTVSELRYSVTYDWKPTAWMQHKLFSSVSRRWEKFYNHNAVERLVNNPTSGNFANAANAVRRRAYLRSGDGAENTALFPLLDGSGPGGLRSEFVDVASNASRATARGSSTLDGWSVSASSNWWQGRIRSLVGTRQDTYHQDDDPVVVNATTGIREFQPSRETIDNVVSSPFYGLLLQPVNWVTVYGTKAYSFSPVSFGTTPLGEPVGTRKGKGDEVGVRFDFLRGKAYFSAAVFNVAQTNVGVNVGPAVTDINAIWNDAVINGAIPGYLNNQLLGGNNEGVDQESDGYELELFTNLTPSWSLTANYTNVENSQTTIPEKIVGYINAQLPGWQALADGNAAIASSINPELGNLRNFLANQIPGARGLRNYKHTVNAFTRYTFREGPLKNFGLGGGVNYSSRPVLFSEVSNGAIVTGFGDDRLSFSALLNYSRKFSRFRWTIALNVENVTDEDYFDELSLTNSNYGAPRSWSLTNTFTF